MTTIEGEAPGDTTTTAPETTTTAQETTTTQADLPGIGDPVRDGKFEFIVTGIEEPGKIIWDGKEFDAEGFTWNGTNIEELNPASCWRQR